MRSIPGPWKRKRMKEKRETEENLRPTPLRHQLPTQNPIPHKVHIHREYIRPSPMHLLPQKTLLQRPLPRHIILQCNISARAERPRKHSDVPEHRFQQLIPLRTTISPQVPPTLELMSKAFFQSWYMLVGPSCAPTPSETHTFGCGRVCGGCG